MMMVLLTFDKEAYMRRMWALADGIASAQNCRDPVKDWSYLSVSFL